MGREDDDNYFAGPAGFQEGDFSLRLRTIKEKESALAAITSQTASVRIKDILKPPKHDVSVVPARLHVASKVADVLVAM